MKFKIYDKVWVIYADSVHERIVFKRSENIEEEKGITTKRLVPFTEKDGTTSIWYTVGKEVERRDRWKTFREDQVFATKQELLDSL